MKRIAAIDFGLARLGLAYTDILQMIAHPAGALPCPKNLREGLDSAYDELAKSVLQALKPQFPLECIVIGLPLLLSGKDSDMTKFARKFAAALETISGLPIVLWDERLSTQQVERSLKECGVNRKNRTPLVDSHCAALILQNYLDAKKACGIS